MDKSIVKEAMLNWMKVKTEIERYAEAYLKAHGKWDKDNYCVSIELDDYNQYNPYDSDEIVDTICVEVKYDGGDYTGFTDHVIDMKYFYEDNWEEVLDSIAEEFEKSKRDKLFKIKTEQQQRKNDEEKAELTRLLKKFPDAIKNVE